MHVQMDLLMGIGKITYTKMMLEGLDGGGV